MSEAGIGDNACPLGWNTIKDGEGHIVAMGPPHTTISDIPGMASAQAIWAARAAAISNAYGNDSESGNNSIFNGRNCFISRNVSCATIINGRGCSIEGSEANDATILGGRNVKVTAPCAVAAGYNLTVHGARAAVFGSDLTVDSEEALVLGTRHGRVEMVEGTDEIRLRRGECSLIIAPDGVWVETPATGRRQLPL